MIKIAPFKNLQNLSILSVFLFPLASDLQGTANGKPYLDHDGYLWWTRVYFDQYLNANFKLFLESDFYYRIDRKLDPQNSSLSLPLKAFLSYFPSSMLSVYITTEATPTLGSKPFISTYYAQGGLGGKYQLNSFMEIELLYTYFFAGNNFAGAGQTYNVGVRVIR